MYQQEIIRSNVDTLLPRVDSEVFDQHPKAVFWVGQVATINSVLAPAEFVGALQLRANTYIDDLGWLDERSRDEVGREIDEDDARSVHFAILEKNGSIQPKVVGASRLILKTSESDKLPIERFYPEAFADTPAELGAVEGSRLIARHPNQFKQHLISMANIRAMDLWALNEKVPYIYGVAERPLLRFLKLHGFPYEQLSDYKNLPEYGDTLNAAIRFDPRKVAALNPENSSRATVLKKFFEEAVDTLGLGYFDEELEKTED